MEQALTPHLIANDFVFGSTTFGEGSQLQLKRIFGLYKHSSASQLKSLLGEKNWRNYYTFSFVRHPVARLYSLYTYALTQMEKTPMTVEEQGAYKSNGTLPTRRPYKFATTKLVLDAADFNDFLLGSTVFEQAGSLPMWKSLCDEEGKLLVSFAGKLENIAEDWQQVEKHLKLETTVGRKNPSNTKISTNTPKISREAWIKLEEECGRDCEVFGYSLKTFGEN